MGFDITAPGIIHCGAGTFSTVADETARLGGKAAIVTGGHLHGSERVGCTVRELADRGVESFVAPAVTSEPTVDMVDALSAGLRAGGSEVVVAIGGGSVMDAAKAAAVVATNEGNTEDYQLKRREIVNPPLAQVFVPTTAGTGSEATRVSVLTNVSLGIKRSISHPLMTPDVVALDPELAASLNLYLTTACAMDAFSHAIESAVSRNSNAYTRAIALAAVERLDWGLPRCQRDLSDLDARLACLQGACFAGLAMQAGMGASHSLAPAVCIVRGMRHSEAVGSLLPGTIRLNRRSHPTVYEQVERAMGCRDVAARIEELCAGGGFECSLARFGLTSAEWPEVLQAMNRYASHRQTNPSDVTDDYAHELFEISLAS